MKSIKKIESLFLPMLEPEVEPVIVQGVNDRYLYKRDFVELGVDTLYVCNPHTMEIGEYSCNEYANSSVYTGGGRALFLTKIDAATYAYNKFLKAKFTEMTHKNEHLRSVRRRLKKSGDL